jgi:hypothetical protein
MKTLFILQVIIIFSLNNIQAQQPIIKGDDQTMFFDNIKQYVGLRGIAAKSTSICKYVKNDYYQFSIKTVVFSEKWIPTNYKFHLVKKTSETKEKNQMIFYWYDAMTQAGEKYSVGFEVDGNGWIKLFVFSVEQNDVVFTWHLTNDNSDITWN